MNDKERTVCLTGAASGIGRHLAQEFYSRGWRVIALDIDLKGLKLAHAERLKDRARFEAHKLDVTKAADWNRIQKKLQSQKRQIHVMMNVAGYLRAMHFADAPEQEIDRHFDINVKGLMLGCKFALEFMPPEVGGHIINISSLSGVAPIPGISLYGASKFAVRGFSLTLAAELKERGVAVSVVCPGVVSTPMVDHEREEKAAAILFSGKKPLRTEDIVAIIFNKVLPKRPLEVMISTSQGLQARIVGFFPVLGYKMSQRLIAQGLKRMGK